MNKCNSNIGAVLKNGLNPWNFSALNMQTMLFYMEFWINYISTWIPESAPHGKQLTLI